MKNYNYNYVFLMYDVDEKRCQKVFKICKKYLTHFQNSVFRGEITPANLLRLQNELKKVIDKNNDRIDFLKFISSSYFNEESIGKKISTAEDLIL